MSQTYEDYLLSFLHSGNDKPAVTLIRNNPQLAERSDRLNSFLVLAVRKNCPEAVTLLAEMGADLGQKIDGRGLIQYAPRDSEVKRLLRSIKSASKISSAMTDAGELPAAPTSSMSL